MAYKFEVLEVREDTSQRRRVTTFSHFEDMVDHVNALTGAEPDTPPNAVDARELVADGKPWKIFVAPECLSITVERVA